MKTKEKRKRREREGKEWNSQANKIKLRMQLADRGKLEAKHI